MAEKTSYLYTLPGGGEIEIETLPEPKRGAGEVSSASQKAEKMALAEVLEPLGKVTQLLFEKIKSSVPEPPDSVTVEFSATIKGQTKLLIVSGEGQGSIKVSLTWKKNS